MKKLFLCLSFGIVVSSVSAQQIEYQTFVYTDPGLADEIQHLSLETERSVGSDMLDATFNATKGIASGWVTSLVDMGVNAIASLVTVNSRHRAEWNAMIEKENVFETTLNTLSDLNDFYEKPSFSGPMDPKGMVFNGIGCLKTEDSDTTFHISCHIDRRKLHRIIDHSKFELVLDTLIISPQHSSLPNTPLDSLFVRRTERL
ncbi:MAG: hypothetical protein LUC96_05615 [Alistipes sp.]|uniref:hypothetical protein n=1 Tax=Alistipes sp. TaxID=1872444 RepID=UPI0025C18E82|nr:hypothetical protein [Alistipes sp.]MCD8274449.1 hypothetical protein [Alistipes sp.]